MPESAENFNSLEELSRLNEHLTTVAYNQSLTGLKFAKEIRQVATCNWQETLTPMAAEAEDRDQPEAPAAVKRAAKKGSRAAAARNLATALKAATNYVAAKKSAAIK